MIESIFAGLLLMSFIIFMVPSELVVKPDLSYKGYEMLEKLERKGVLRAYLFNTTKLMEEIDIPGYSYSVSVCDTRGNCIGNLPNATNIWVSSRIVSKNDIYVVRLYIWE